jgi:hypothetical protein
MQEKPLFCARFVSETSRQAIVFLGLSGKFRYPPEHGIKSAEQGN